MTDKVLTDDEQEALLDGLSSGEVEVQSNDGPLYAEVQPYVIGPRSHITTNAYPRLQMINKQMAGRLAKQAELLLGGEIEIVERVTESCMYGEVGERMQGLSLAIEFSVAPLNGSGFVYLESGIIGHLMEAFFGGSGKEAIPQDADAFSIGEISVAHRFCDLLLEAIQDVWQPLVTFSPERTATRDAKEIIDNIDMTDEVICTEFEMAFAEHQEIFYLVWPVATVVSLVPVFKGQKRDRDLAEDRRWEETLRNRTSGLVVEISSRIGHAEMSLADVADLRPGDIIDIDSPRMATVFAQQVPILQGRFGVHDGRNAVEATRWLEPDCDTTQTASHASN